MGTESLNVPEEHLADVIRVIRRGLEGPIFVAPEVRERLARWCDETEEYVGLVEADAEKRPGLAEPYLLDLVTLSNKACPRYYGAVKSVGDPPVRQRELVGSKRCTCPEGRCWYDEQKARRAEGKLAIAPEHWPEPEG